MLKKYARRAKQLILSGSFVIGLEHFLVMFPSAMLVAKLTNTPYGSVIELPSLLFACGIGTILFAFLTKKKIPFFLGPSFSYIGFVSYQVAKISGPADIGVIRSTILYGYLIAGIILMLLCVMYRFKVIKHIINKVFPSTVMGPSISLIGLELANLAAQDSGLLGKDKQLIALSLITLSLIIVLSLLRHHFLQNASVLLGIILGCIIASSMGLATWPQFSNFTIQFPVLHFESFKHSQQWISLTLAVFPCSMIAFIESLGRLSVYEGMMKRDGKDYNDKTSNSAITAHSFANLVTSATLMMPSAIYAENLAIMNLHSADLSTKSTALEDEDPFINNCYSNYSIYPYYIASAVSIMVALIGNLQDIFTAIPIQILGGMELFVFGLITAPGIQLLVDQQVNYKKISNQIITASVFLAGISNISITHGPLTLKGMSLGLTIGVIVNFVSLLLDRVGLLNEKFSLIEVLDLCIEECDKSIVYSISYDKGNEPKREREASDFREYIHRSDVAKRMKEARGIEIKCDSKNEPINIVLQYGRIDLIVSLPIKYRNKLNNDHPRITLFNDNRSSHIFTIAVNEYVPSYVLSEIIKNAL